MTTAPDVERLANLRAAKDLMDRSYAEALDLDSIAREAGYYRFHFIRSLRGTYGRTPRDYLSFRRVERARDQSRGRSFTVGISGPRGPSWLPAADPRLLRPDVEHSPKCAIEKKRRAAVVPRVLSDDRWGITPTNGPRPRVTAAPTGG